jgi:hypothetical protein
MAVSSVVFTGFFYNWYSYDTYLPDINDIENAYIYSSTFAESYNAYAYSMDESGAVVRDNGDSSFSLQGLLYDMQAASSAYTAVDVDKLYSMLDSCTYKTSAFKQKTADRVYKSNNIFVSSSGAGTIETEQEFISSVYVQFVLKNGKVSVRNYTLSVNDELKSFFEDVVNNDEYMRKNYPISTGEWSQPLYFSVQSFNNGVGYSYTSEVTIADYDETDKIIEAYREDFKEHSSVAELLDFTTQNLYTLELYYREVSYTYSDEVGESIECFYLDVPKTYTRTIKCIEEYFK